MEAQPNRSTAHGALNQLLTALAPTLANQTTALDDDPSTRLSRCIELVKAEASEASSLIADCAPQGRPMLTQAQKTLESLESLKLLEMVVSEACRE